MKIKLLMVIAIVSVVSAFTLHWVKADPLDYSNTYISSLCKVAVFNLSGTIICHKIHDQVTFEGLGGTTLGIFPNNNTVTISSTTSGKAQGTNLGSSGTGLYCCNFNATELEFYKLISANSNCVITTNSTNVILTCSGGSTGLVSLNGDTHPAQTVNSANNNHITVTNSGATHSIDTAFKINNSTCSAGQSHTAFDNATGNFVCSPSSGVTSISGTAGNITASASTGAVTLNLGNNAVVNNNFNTYTAGKEQFFVPNATRAGINIGEVSVDPTNPKTGSIWERGGFIIFKSSGAGNVITTTRTGSNTFTGVNSFRAGIDFILQDISDSTKQLQFLLSGMTSGKTLTIRVNQTTTQGLNIPNIRETETLAIQPQTGILSNSTGQAITVSTGSYRAIGYPVSITPQITGNVRYTFTSSIADSVATDGCSIEFTFGTSTAPHSGAAQSGTLIGIPILTTSATASANDPISFTYVITGLVQGTTYWIMPSVETLTGGTCTMNGGLAVAQEY